MTRFLTFVVCVLALLSTLAEARSQRIHVSAEVVETTVIGDPSEPKIGDQRITSMVGIVNLRQNRAELVQSMIVYPLQMGFLGG